MSASPIAVSGRLLDTPAVRYASGKKAKVEKGAWDMARPPLKFTGCAILRNWKIILLNTMERDKESAKKNLMYVMKETGIEGIPEPIVQEIRPRDLEGSIKRAAEESTDLVFFVFPPSLKHIYKDLKIFADTKYGVKTACCINSKVAKRVGAYHYNLALKINLKLGGNNQRVDPDSLDFIAEDRTMIVGIDVTHPSPGSSSDALSVAGVVASIDCQLGQWPGVLSSQEGGQEMVTNLKQMLKTRLVKWCKKGRHECYPENILVYRDGVSEGQYSTVLEQELPQIRAACQETYPASDTKKGLPRITIVVVGKRHNTRFYAPKSRGSTNNLNNPPPGLVVDRGVTEVRNWDFFLQSHAPIQGTARPAHYFVICDEIFCQTSFNKQNRADTLQKITQSLCYMFGRATKAVSYCTPAYYADILCERARCYLHQHFEQSTTGDGPRRPPASTSVKIHENLEDTMFYI